MTDSQKLLAEYAQTGSEAAFRELVSRYLNLVYSTALRLVGGDAHLAEDVAQTVFISLANKGRTLSTEVMLGGWLHQQTFHAATKAMRTNRRRVSRERQAVEMNKLADDSESRWRQVAPILDEAITKLETNDRTAILLRFFEQRNFQAVGEALGSNEDAARMRVNRALGKLHALLKHRGVTLSITGLGAVLTAKAVAAAPTGLAVAFSGIALASTAAGNGTTLTILKVMASTKFKIALATFLVAGTAATLTVQHQSETTLREENESLRHQITQRKGGNEDLPSLAIQSNESASLPVDQFNELLRLRGEQGVYRAQTADLARLSQENQYLRSKIATLSEAANSDATNQIPVEDRYILQQTHAAHAMQLLLQAMNSYTTNHNGQFPERLEQLTVSGDLKTNNFAGNLGLGDFELVQDGTVDFRGYKVILSLRTPLPRKGMPSVIIRGAIDKAGISRVETLNVSP
jgi:RNA polymerase sigma factor (sigma-70 family)